jgi:hypothetical protein
MLGRPASIVCRWPKAEAETNIFSRRNLRPVLTPEIASRTANAATQQRLAFKVIVPALST